MRLVLRRRCCFISEDSLPHPPPGLSLYLSLGTLLPWRSARSQFRILLLPIFRFFRLSPSSSFRPALPLSLAVGSVTLREPTAVRTFLFQTRLLFSLRLSPSTLSPLSALLSPFLRSLFLRSFSLLLFPHRASCNLATGPDNSFSSLRLPSTFVSSTFCTDCTEDESEDIFVPDVVSDRKAFLSNLTAPGQLEHSFSEAEVIVFASAHFLSLLLSFLLEISTGKINTGRFLPSTKDRGKVWSFDDVAR